MKKVILVLFVALIAVSAYSQKTRAEIKDMIPYELRQAIPDNSFVNYEKVKPILEKYAVVLSILDREYRQSPDGLEGKDAVDCECKPAEGLFKYRIYCSGGWACDGGCQGSGYGFGCGYWEDCPADGSCTWSWGAPCDQSTWCPACSAPLLDSEWYIMWCWYEDEPNTK